jgi:hypothetical protein
MIGPGGKVLAARATAIAHEGPDEQVFAEAVSGSVHLAAEIGSASNAIEGADDRPVSSIIEPRMTAMIADSKKAIAAWHAYLNVDRLHSDHCLRVSFITVSSLTPLLEEFRTLTAAVHERHPDYVPDHIVEEVTSIADDYEDILASLAILIDDDARAALQSLLVDAGLDGRMLSRENGAGTGRTAAD